MSYETIYKNKNMKITQNWLQNSVYSSPTPASQTH